MAELIFRGNDGYPLFAAIIDSIGKPATAGERPFLVLLHGGGPDHCSLVRLAYQLADRHRIVLPDIPATAGGFVLIPAAILGRSTPTTLSLCSTT